jgi:undecaprenyl-diphosphatase
MTPTLTDQILWADQQLFLILNGQHSPFWDGIMQAITFKFTWVPLYGLLLYGIVSTFDKKAVGYIFCIIAVVALSDQLASALFKPLFMRPRPCHEPEIRVLMHLVGNCGGPYGFISSHAATSFGIATVVNLLPTRRVAGVVWLYLWALVYSYSRVYVGVHYPLDILFGGMAGVLVAYLLAGLYPHIAARIRSDFV